MVTHLEDEFSLIRLAREADMSEFHFSRAFQEDDRFHTLPILHSSETGEGSAFAERNQPERHRDRTRCWLH